MAKTQAKKASNKNNQNDNRPIGMSKITEEDENKSQNPDEEINSGFGSYLRSGEGKSFSTTKSTYYAKSRVFFSLD